jgi:hypothetical protein
MFDILGVPGDIVSRVSIEQATTGGAVGRNALIKNYDATPEGQPLELLEGKGAHLPIIIELLKSPWIVKASELVGRDGASATKRAEEAVCVVWDAEHQCPAYFQRERTRYHIDAIVQIWATERTWWDPRRRVSRRYWRVLARGGVYDLAYDRAQDVWLLVGIQD